MSNPRYKNGHRRRKLRARILATETHCALCGQPVDQTLHHLDPMAPEIDEIIPISHGGNPLSRANTQLVHRTCNQRKSNGTRTRTPTTAPLPISQPW